MDVKFYKCMHCGNIAVKVFDAECAAGVLRREDG